MKDDPSDLWVIETYWPTSRGWAPSKLNEDGIAHSLQWCLDKWHRESTTPTAQFLGGHEKYRLRNVVTNEIIMCYILS